MASLASEEPLPPGQLKTEEELPVEETAPEKKARKKREKKKRQAATKKKKKEQEAAMGTKAPAAKAPAAKAAAAKAASRENDPLTVLLLSEQHNTDTCSDVQVDRIIECIGRVLLYHGKGIIPDNVEKNLHPKRDPKAKIKGPARIKGMLQLINDGYLPWMQNARELLKKSVRFMGEMQGTITKEDFQVRELNVSQGLEFARQTGSHSCFAQFMNRFPNIFEFDTLAAGGAELDDNSSPLQKIIFCTMMISGRLIFPPPEKGKRPQGMETILYAGNFSKKGMCLCYPAEQCPDWELMNPESINKPIFLKQVMTNLQTRINQLDEADKAQLDRAFNVYSGRGELLGKKSFNEAFQELFATMRHMWDLFTQPDSQGQIDTIYKEYKYQARVLINLCMVEARNITWVKKMESVALNNPEILLLIVPCGAEHFEGMIRDILTNPNLRISNLSQSYIDITKPSSSVGKASMQAADVELSEKDKQKLKDEGALPATEHIILANANHGQGFRAPEHRSQEPENPDRPYTRIGGKKKTRKKRKTKRKRKRKTRRKRKRKTRRKRNRTRKKICRFR